MADEKIAEGWKDVEKLLTKGKTNGALDILREIDPEGKEATTLRLAGQAIFMQASKNNSNSDFRKAAKLLRDAVKMNPRDKQSGALYNQILNEMQDKSISETIFPRLANDGTPTPAGLFAIVAALLIILAAIQFVQGDSEFEDGEAVMRITWTDDLGILHDEKVTIALHRAEAPLHVENFILLAEDGKYDNVIFHRVISNFMIQGGDFEMNSGGGGYTAQWYGYCNGKTTNSEGVEYTAETCQLKDWSLPSEHTNGLRHGVGSLAAAHAGLNTDGSQFYIVPSDSNPCWLDGDQTQAPNGAPGCVEDKNKDCSAESCHTVYGTVTDGIEHIDAISKVNTGQNDKPSYDVTIVSIEITDYGIADSEAWYKFW
ncbi:MAG: peptidylprolyl isomerase [Candidatus Poseidoniaceae archaeon]